jgi:hypothetical protein
LNVCRIAARFTEEHRLTLDWLNRITDESFRFFGLEVELWRIGDSPPAPKFNIVSKPNDWSQSVAQAARAIDEAELSETRVMQRAYWAAFDKVLAASDGAGQWRQEASAASMDGVSYWARWRQFGCRHDSPQKAGARRTLFVGCQGEGLFSSVRTGQCPLALFDWSAAQVPAIKLN